MLKSWLKIWWVDDILFLWIIIIILIQFYAFQRNGILQCLSWDGGDVIHFLRQDLFINFLSIERPPFLLKYRFLYGCFLLLFSLDSTFGTLFSLTAIWSYWQRGCLHESSHRRIRNIQKPPDISHPKTWANITTIVLKIRQPNLKFHCYCISTTQSSVLSASTVISLFWFAAQLFALCFVVFFPPPKGGLRDFTYNEPLLNVMLSFHPIILVMF